MMKRAKCSASALLAISLSLAALLVLPESALAHGSLHEQIGELDRRLAADPDNANLLLRRGDLHRRHQSWDEALADFSRTTKFDPGAIEVHFLRARTYLDSDRPRRAAAEFQRYLALLPEETEQRDRRGSTLLLLGQALRQRGRPLEAADCFRHAIDLVERPGPQAFLDCARAFDAADHLDSALDCLEDGIARLGPVVSLERAAIDIEIQRGDFDAALARIERLAGLSPRKESWLVERGEILTQSGRPREARRSFLAARRAIAELPLGRRQSRTVAELDERIAAGLE